MHSISLLALVILGAAAVLAMPPRDPSSFTPENVERNENLGDQSQIHENRNDIDVNQDWDDDDRDDVDRDTEDRDNWNDDELEYDREDDLDRNQDLKEREDDLDDRNDWDEVERSEEPTDRRFILLKKPAHRRPKFHESKFDRPKFHHSEFEHRPRKFHRRPEKFHFESHHRPRKFHGQFDHSKRRYRADELEAAERMDEEQGSRSDDRKDDRKDDRMNEQDDRETDKNLNQESQWEEERSDETPLVRQPRSWTMHFKNQAQQSSHNAGAHNLGRQRLNTGIQQQSHGSWSHGKQKAVPATFNNQWQQQHHQQQLPQLQQRQHHQAPASLNAGIRHQQASHGSWNPAGQQQQAPATFNAGFNQNQQKSGYGAEEIEIPTFETEIEEPEEESYGSPMRNPIPLTFNQQKSGYGSEEIEVPQQVPSFPEIEEPEQKSYGSNYQQAPTFETEIEEPEEESYGAPMRKPIRLTFNQQQKSGYGSAPAVPQAPTLPEIEEPAEESYGSNFQQAPTFEAPAQKSYGSRVQNPIQLTFTNHQQKSGYGSEEPEIPQRTQSLPRFEAPFQKSYGARVPQRTPALPEIEEPAQKSYGARPQNPIPLTFNNRQQKSGYGAEEPEIPQPVFEEPAQKSYGSRAQQAPAKLNVGVPQHSHGSWNQRVPQQQAHQTFNVGAQRNQQRGGY